MLQVYFNRCSSCVIGRKSSSWVRSLCLFSCRCAGTVRSAEQERDKSRFKFVTVFEGLCTEECVWDGTGGCLCIQRFKPLYSNYKYIYIYITFILIHTILWRTEHLYFCHSTLIIIYPLKLYLTFFHLACFGGRKR